MSAESCTKKSGTLTVGRGGANGDCGRCAWVGVGGRAWAVGNCQGGRLSDRVGVVSLNYSGWDRAL